MIQLNSFKASTSNVYALVPDGVYLDADGLAEIDLGNGTNYSPQEALNMFFQTGSVIGRILYKSEGDHESWQNTYSRNTHQDLAVIKCRALIQHLQLLLTNDKRY